MEAANILRERVLKRQQSSDGSFRSGAEEASIPLCLAKFITMIIDGSQYEENPSDSTKTISTSIAHLLSLNCVERRRLKTGAARHPKERETRWPKCLP
jgi:hypothetical protein